MKKVAQKTMSSFGRYKALLADILTTPMILQLATFFEYPPAKIDELDKHSSPGFLMVRYMEERGQISSTDITPLLRAPNKLDLHGTESSVRKLFEEHTATYRRINCSTTNYCLAGVVFLIISCLLGYAKVDSGNQDILWALPFIIIVLCIGATISIIVWLKCRGGSSTNEVTATNIGEERIPIMEVDHGQEPRYVFINQLKFKYKLLYDAIQPIPYIKDKMYCVNDLFVEGGIELMESRPSRSGQRTTWKVCTSYHDIFRRNCHNALIQIIEGEPGYGKSTLALQFAFDWCNNVQLSPLKDKDILIVLRLRQLGNIRSIYRAIKQFLLPMDTSLSENAIRHILETCNSLVIILDSYDEYPEQNITKDTDINNIIRRNLLQNAFVTLTTRRFCLPKDLIQQTERIQLKGFDNNAREMYLRKAFPDNDEKAIQKIQFKLQKNPVLGELCQVPLLFVMFAHVTSEEEDIDSESLQSVTGFFRHLIACLHTHTRNKMKDTNVDHVVFEEEHTQLDKLAYDALSQQSTQLVWQKKHFCEKVGKEFYEQYLRVGILVEEEVLTYDNELEITFKYQTEVRFYHKLFCEWYAAKYVAKYIAQEHIKGTIWLGDLFEEPNGKLTASTNGDKEVEFISGLLAELDPYDLQYVYRFSCGLSHIAADKIIDFLQIHKDGQKFAILCTLEQDESVKNILHSVKELVSVRTPIRESESKLLQRSTIYLLEIASKNNILIFEVPLLDLFKSVDFTIGGIILRSGLILPILSHLQWLSIKEEGRELTHKEVNDILWYASKCDRMERLGFGGCVVPQILVIDSFLETLQSRDIKVFWGDGYLLNLTSLRWEDKGGKQQTDGDYDARVTFVRKNHSNSKWQKARVLLEGDTSG